MPYYRLHRRPVAIVAAVAAMCMVAIAAAAPKNLRRHLWESPDFGFAASSSLAESPTLLFAYTGDNVVAVDKSDGTIAWTSPALQSSASFLPWASPIYTSSNNRVAVASGLFTDATFYLLNADTGAIEQSVNLGVNDGVVNGTPAHDSGVYYIHTNPNYADPTTSWLIALNEADLTDAWRVNAGGNGSNKPVVSGGVVYDFAYEGPVIGGEQRVRAFNAATGATIWTSTISLPAPPYGGLSLHNGDILFGTYDFADSDPNAPTSEIISLDSADGSLNWRVPGAASDGTPIGSGSAIYTFGAYSYGLFTALSTADGAILWSRDEGNWAGSAAVADGVVFWAGHPSAGFATDRWLMAADAATGDYLDSIHLPAADGTPLVNGDIVYIGGGGRVQAFTEAPELVRIKEAYVTSASEDYVILENIEGSSVDLAGWEIQADDGLTTDGYATVATLPSHSLDAAAPRAGASVIIGSVENTIAGVTPELVVSGFDLPDLTGAGTVRGVRLVNPAGDVIDTVIYNDNAAAGQAPEYAADDTGDNASERSLDGLSLYAAMRRTGAVDTNNSADDFEVEAFMTAVEGWVHYE